MNNFRRVCSAAVLTLVFALPTLAGDVPCPPAAAPGDVGFPPATAPGDVGFPPAAALGIMDTPGLAIVLFAISNLA